jgi:hypothetical protein
MNRVGVAHLWKGDHGKALAEIERGNVPPYQEGYPGYAYAVSGEREKARKIIETLKGGSRPAHLTPYQLAMIYFGLEEKDKAFEWLNKACEQRSPQLFWIKVVSEFDSARADPRFQSVLRRMNLAD